MISGRNDIEHLEHLKSVLPILKSDSLKLKLRKCVFLQPEVTYLGFRINKDGVLPLLEKAEIIKNAQVSKKVTKLKPILGFINYYHRHLNNFSSFLEPLHCLLRKETPWKWIEKENNSFNKARKLLSSANLLVHYDTKKPLNLACDASPYGQGAVLSHIMEDGSERPIAFASRTLSKAKQNYLQIEKEGLAVISGVKKFHQYVYGRPFQIITDHKPLLGLLHEHKSIPSMAASRIQRYAILLSAYNYELIFKSGRKH